MYRIAAYRSKIFAGTAGTNRRPRVLFVGSFRPAKKDSWAGGQLFACRALMASGISDRVDWVTLDTTMESLPLPGIGRRIWLAAKRAVRFLTLVPKVDAGLIFSTAGIAMYEKGLMTLLLSVCGRRAVLAPRSGDLLHQLEQSPMMRVWLRFVAKRSNGVLCQSASWRAAFVRHTGLPATYFPIQPNWIDVRAYERIAACRTAPCAAPVFLFLGSVVRAKGIFEIIQALAQTGNALARARLIVCGAGPDLHDLMATARRCGVADRVETRGRVAGADKEKALADADVLVLPSYFEGMPNALIEGMASGLAVIASRVGGIPDTLGNDEYGILVEPRDVASLAKAMVRLAPPASRAQYGEKARSRAATRHAVALAWPQILKLLVAERAGCAQDLRPR